MTDQERADRAIRLISRGDHISLACKRARIDRPTLWRLAGERILGALKAGREARRMRTH
jgi:hypothetical protein